MCAPKGAKPPPSPAKAPSLDADTGENLISSGLVTALPVASLLSLLLYLLRMFMKGAQFKETVRAEGKCAMVTCAGSVLGTEAVRELNKRGAIVYMLCEDRYSGATLRTQLSEVGCDPSRIILKVVDLENKQCVSNFAAELQHEISHLDILINITSMMFCADLESTKTVTSSQLGHFQLTELMLPLLRKSKGGRVVVVTSRSTRTDNDAPSSISSHIAYQLSQQVNTMYVRELTRRLRDADPSSSVSANCCTPGRLYADVAGNLLRSQTSIFRRIALPFLWFFTKSITDGVQTALYLSLSSGIQHVSGKFFRECDEEKVTVKLVDETLSSAIYEACLNVVATAQ